MTKIILGLLLISGVSWGQSTGQNVVNVIVVPSNTYLSNITLTSAPLQNIGQTLHQLNLNVSSIGSNSATLAILGSTDGITYKNISNNFATNNSSSNLSTGSPYVISVVGYGSFPFIETQVTLTVPMGGSLAVYGVYVGVSNPFSTLIDMFGSSGIVSFPATLTNSASNQTFLILTDPTKSITVYGYTLNIPTTATLFQLGCNNIATPTVFDYLTVSIPSPTAGLFIWANSVRPYFQCAIGENLSYKLTGTGGGEFSINYRLE